MTAKESLRSPAVEDYAKAIFSLQARAATPVSTNALAERLGITPGSVSAMLRKLDELGLITHIPYRGVRLTTAGRRLALEVIRHHRLLESFLAESLGMPWDRVHAEAEVLGNPTVDPHGDPIPSVEFVLEEHRTVSLNELPPGAAGRFVRVSDSDPEMLRYLVEQGIALGDRLEVAGRQPFDGPVLVRFGDQELPIGGRLARAMRIEVEASQP